MVATFTLLTLECSIVTGFRVFRPEGADCDHWAWTKMSGSIKSLNLTEMPKFIVVKDAESNKTHIYKVFRVNKRGETVFKSSTRDVAINLRQA